MGNLNSLLDLNKTEQKKGISISKSKKKVKKDLFATMFNSEIKNEKVKNFKSSRKESLKLNENINFNKTPNLKSKNRKIESALKNGIGKKEEKEIKKINLNSLNFEKKEKNKTQSFESLNSDIQRFAFDFKNQEIKNNSIQVKQSDSKTEKEEKHFVENRKSKLEFTKKDLQPSAKEEKKERINLIENQFSKKEQFLVSEENKVHKQKVEDKEEPDFNRSETFQKSSQKTEDKKEFNFNKNEAYQKSSLDLKKYQNKEIKISHFSEQKNYTLIEKSLDPEKNQKAEYVKNEKQSKEKYSFEVSKEKNPEIPFSSKADFEQKLSKNDNQERIHNLQNQEHIQLTFSKTEKNKQTLQENRTVLSNLSKHTVKEKSINSLKSQNKKDIKNLIFTKNENKINSDFVNENKKVKKQINQNLKQIKNLEFVTLKNETIKQTQNFKPYENNQQISTSQNRFDSQEIGYNSVLKNLENDSSEKNQKLNLTNFEKQKIKKKLQSLKNFKADKFEGISLKDKKENLQKLKDLNDKDSNNTGFEFVEFNFNERFGRNEEPKKVSNFDTTKLFSENLTTNLHQNDNQSSDTEQGADSYLTENFENLQEKLEEGSKFKNSFNLNLKLNDLNIRANLRNQVLNLVINSNSYLFTNSALTNEIKTILMENGFKNFNLTIKEKGKKVFEENNQKNNFSEIKYKSFGRREINVRA